MSITKRTLRNLLHSANVYPNRAGGAEAMRQISLWLTVAIAGATLAVGQQSTVKRLDGSTISTAEIDATVTRLMKAAEVTGAGIAVFNHGKIAYMKAYGFRDKEKNLPLTVDSVM